MRLNWPNIDSVMEYRSCIVDQCTISDPATTAPESPIRAMTPAAAARSASGIQFGSGEAASSRRPTRDPTPAAAPIACTTSTPPKARSESGVCNSVSTDAASWITARQIAAISSGPPSAEATTHLVTNHDELTVAAAVVRAVP